MKISAVLLSSVLVMSLGCGAHAQTPAPAPAQTSHVLPEAATCAQFQLLMDAIEEDDYIGFLASTDDTFKAALPKPAFERVVALVAPRLKAGYTATFLTQLRKNGFLVSVWKIEFKDGGDDMLGELSLKNGKVGGFFLL